MAKRVGLVLHFYQPPVQDLALTKQVLTSAYMPVLQLLVDHPKARATLNISACLLQQLNKLRKQEFFDLLKEAIRLKKVELLNSPAFHPVLPLVSEETIERQFQKAEWIYQDLVGVKPGRGIFCPELAVDQKTVERIKRYGDYTIVDGTARTTNESVFINQGMKVFVNNRMACDVLRSYPSILLGDSFGKWIGRELGEQEATVIVSDVEVFGHHYSERIQTLVKLFEVQDLEFVTLNQLMDLPAEEGGFVDSSWQHVREDKYQSGPFWLWNNGQNPLQTQYWELAKLAEQIFDETKSETDNLVADSAAEHLDKGLSSCYAYWISNWPWWHPDLVERGVQQLAKCVRTVRAGKEKKLQMEQQYHGFLADLWKLHWSGQVEENYRQFEIEREKLMQNLPSI